MRIRRDAENLFESSLRLCHWIRPESRFTLKARLETEHKSIDKSRVDKGRIAAEGTHTELLQDSPLYQKMWQSHISGRDNG